MSEDIARKIAELEATLQILGLPAAARGGRDAAESAAECRAHYEQRKPATHGAVMATSPPSTPLSVKPRSGLPIRSHESASATTPPAAAAMLVFAVTCAITSALLPIAASWLPGLKPNHPSQRMNTPSVPSATE